MSLLGLGYGLGGFMQGYDQQQRSQLQNQIYQQQFAQLQRQLAAQRLLGGFSGDTFGGVGGGLSNFQPQATSPAPMPPPQFGGTSGQSSGGAPTLIPGGALGGGGASLPQLATGSNFTRSLGAGPFIQSSDSGSGSGSSAGTPPPLSAGADGASTPLPGGGAFAPIPPAAPSLSPAQQVQAEVDAEPAPAARPATQATSPQPEPAAATGPTSPPAATTTPAGPDRQTLSFVQDLLDPQHAYRAIGDLRDRIAKAAPPGTDPATIWEATTELYKMVGGSINERAQAASIMKLAGLDLGYAKLGETQKSHETQAGLAQQRIDTQRAGQAGVQKRFDVREARLAADKAMANADNQSKAEVSRLRALIYSLTTGRGLMGAPDPDSPEGQQLQQAQKRLGQLTGIPQPAPKVAPPTE